MANRTKKQKLVDVFIEASKETLRSQSAAEPKTVRVLPSNEKSASFKMCRGAVIDVRGVSHNGSIRIHFSRELYLKAMSTMLDHNYTEIDHDIEDGAGEFLNIIFGMAKKELNDTGHGLEIAIPRLLRENDSVLTKSKNTEVWHFETDFGDFQMEFDLN